MGEQRFHWGTGLDDNASSHHKIRKWCQALDRNRQLYKNQFSFLHHEKWTEYQCYVHELTSQSSHGILLKTEEIHVQSTFLDDELMDNQQENFVLWSKDEAHLHHS